MRGWAFIGLGMLQAGLLFAEPETERLEDAAGVTVLTQVTFRTVVMAGRVREGGERLARSWKPWVCPGWGHFDLGEPRRGVALMGLFGGCLVSAAVLEVSAWSAYAEHRRLVPVALAEADLDRRRVLMDAAVAWYDRYNIRHSWAQAAAVAAVVVWGYGVFDYFEVLRGWRVAAEVSGHGVAVGWERSW